MDPGPYVPFAKQDMTKIHFLMGSGGSTAKEYTPSDKEVVGSNPARYLAYYLINYLHFSVVCP